MTKRKLADVLPELYHEIDRPQTLAANPSVAIDLLGVWSQEHVVWTCHKHQEPYSWKTQVGYRTRGGTDPRPCPECRRQQLAARKQDKCDPARLATVKREYAGGSLAEFDALALYSMTKLDWRCPCCHTAWQARLSSRLLRNNNCPKCNDRTSKYEKQMIQALCNLGLSYDRQYRLPGSTRKVDFYIGPGIVDIYPLAIEVDGEFHFKGDPQQLLRDQSVDAQCRTQGIHLLRVHHKTRIGYDVILGDFLHQVRLANGQRILHCFVKPVATTTNV